MKIQSSVQQCKFKEAEQLFEFTLENYKNTLGEEHPNTGYIMSYLGETLCDMGRYHEAELLLLQSNKIQEKVSKSTIRIIYTH
ncbi:tetratricopeptide repeat protein [Metabacillus bambusae]|uniref:Tetratricopeptide repeat protein n=1 Tax=Metabacillus bambusae TaxID=2795218 RepID=A0ABS3N811_9BACI|nr:tetratricopeptide repeat protein [Metabacillus bambusae]MBO1514353.1 tetratricopeptide repeat protein [Metabacillus bambusae]